MASSVERITCIQCVNLLQFDALAHKRLYDLCHVIRPEILESARRELSARAPAALWPLHWGHYGLNRTERDRLAHEDKFREKWPSLMGDPTYAFPPAENAEQASSEATAVWKASHMIPKAAQRILDLTAGSGIDTWGFEQCGAKVDCVEPNPYLVELLQWNGRATGRIVHETKAEEFLPHGETYDAIYLDPSRREISGTRIDFSNLGEPNPLEHLETWLAWAPTVILKLSPMVDRRAVQRWFPNADLVVYLSRKREVKELLVRIPRVPSTTPVVLLAVDTDPFGTETYRIPASDVRLPSAPEVLEFIHDPDPALRAAGASDAWALSSGFVAIHPGMSLYTSQSQSAAPGGRHFAVESVYNHIPKDLKSASIVTKNFPEKAEILRKKYGIREDSERFLFALQRGTGGAKSYIVAHRVH